MTMGRLHPRILGAFILGSSGGLSIDQLVRRDLRVGHHNDELPVLLVNLDLRPRHPITYLGWPRVSSSSVAIVLVSF